VTGDRYELLTKLLTKNSKARVARAWK